MLSSLTLDAALCALYLPGLERPCDPPRHRWPAVERALRRSGVQDGPDVALRDAGFFEEAFALAPRSLAEAGRLVECGRAVSAVSPGYPPSLALRLASAAPPAFWSRGSLPCLPLIAVVGSRSPSPGAARLARDIVGAAHRLGMGVVSGGATGCDRIAVRQALRCDIPHLEFLPCGIGRGFGAGECLLSAAHPEKEFSAPAAMERNSLIYASAAAAVVIQPRFKQGGTWLGAVSALRRRLCPVIVWAGEESLAVRALCALGAVPLFRAEDLGSCLASPHEQGALGLYR
ncbi:MAG: DNA-processing protein DprA [Fimbriimonadaceae bacterium]